jgi:hypothetical protein
MLNLRQQAGSTLFSVPSYGLPAEGAAFSAMLECEPGGPGSSDDNPIHLDPDVTAFDFCNLLKIAYPPSVPITYALCLMLRHRQALHARCQLDPRGICLSSSSRESCACRAFVPQSSRSAMMKSRKRHLSKRSCSRRSTESSSGSRKGVALSPDAKRPSLTKRRASLAGRHSRGLWSFGRRALYGPPSQP